MPERYVIERKFVNIILSKNRLKEAIEGIGTDDDMLISTIVLRAEIDLVDIIETYEQLYGTSLEDDVIGNRCMLHSNLSPETYLNYAMNTTQLYNIKNSRAGSL